MLFEHTFKGHCMINKLIIITVAAAAALFLTAGQTTAQKTDLPDNTFRIPDQARRINDNLVYLGTSRDPQSNKVVEGYAIIRRKNHPEKPDHAGKPGGPKNDQKSSCYAYLAKDAKWKTEESWIINPSNTRGMDAAGVFTKMSNGVDKWETAALKTNIIGSGSPTDATLVADTSNLDGVNEVYFGPIDDSSAIAVTVVWGIFGGPPSGRELVEWDQIYDDNKFDWSLTGASSTMDFDNIATHELGHTFGLADLYTSDCVQETMYGYAGYGETNKRDLETGDITGVQQFYR